MAFFTKKRIIEIGASIIVGVALIYFLYRFVDLQEATDKIQNLSFLEISLIFVMAMVVVLISTFRWYAILRAMRKKSPLPFWRLFIIYLAGFPIGYVLPSFGLSGQVGRSYLSERSGINRKLHISSLSLEYIVHLFVNLFAAGGAFLILLISGYSIASKYVWLLVLLFVGWVFLMVYLWCRPPKRIKAYRNDIVKAIKKNPKWMTFAIISVFVGYGVGFIEVYMFSYFLEMPLSFISVFLYYSVTAAFISVPSPFAVGTNEAGGALSFSLLGLSTAAGVALALVYRIADIITAISGSIVLVILLLMKKRK